MDGIGSPRCCHRWRRLEGSDPGSYELLLKLQALQRRLLAKTEEAAEKEAALQVGGSLVSLVKRMKSAIGATREQRSWGSLSSWVCLHL